MTHEEHYRKQQQQDEFQEVADRLDRLHASLAKHRLEMEQRQERLARLNWWINLCAVIAVLSMWAAVLFLTPAP